MNLLERAIRNAPFMAVLVLLLAALGINAWRNIARSEDPSFVSTRFRVVAMYPGAQPEDVERQLMQPIEDAVHQLEDVKEISSGSSDGVGQLWIEFETNVDPEKKYEELTRQINALRPNLPAGVGNLTVSKVDPGRVNIVQIALVSASANWRALDDLAIELRDRLERAPAVRVAEVWGYPQRELRVALSLPRLAELNLRAADVLGAIQRENTNIPGGSVDVGARRFDVRTSGSYASLDELRDTVVAGGFDRLVRVRDIAEVSWRYAPEDYITRLDGERAVFVTAQQNDGQNIFKTKASIDAIVQEFSATLPANVRLIVPFDQSRNVARRLSRLTQDLLIAVMLVLITLLPLGLRAAGIVMVSVPLSLATGLAALLMVGFSLNQLSIAGFVVALGLLVDDSIVVTENIARHLRAGQTRMQAALAATRQITPAVLGCTATLILAFVPLLALPGNPGRFIRVLPATVIFTVIASLFIALAVIPFLAARFLPLHAHVEGNALLRRLLGLIHRVYAPLLRRALGAPRRTLAVSLLLVVGSFALVPVMGVSMFPVADTPQFLVQITLPDGASLTHTDAVLKRVEAELRTHREVRHVISNLGRGNPRIYYNVSGHETSASYAEAFVVLDRYDPQATPRLCEVLRRRFVDIPGADIVVKEFQNGPPVAAPIALRILGSNLEVLRTLSVRLEAVMRATPGTRDVVNPLRRTRLDLKLATDSQRAGLLGVAPSELDLAVRLALSGLPAGSFREENGYSYPVVLRAPMQERPTLAALNGIHIVAAGGGQVPLDQLARPVLVSASPDIQRYNRDRSVELTAYVGNGYNIDRVTREVLVRAARELNLPAGYRLKAGGEVESRQDSFAGFGTAILLAGFGILAVLVLEFGSFKSTLIVATVVPLGAMGGLLTLFLTGNNLSFTAMIGFIALIGIEIKNSILLVDFTNQLRREGLALDEAIARAGEVRFLPILLTSATAIGGLLPLALQGSPLFAPVAWVIVGGLLTSTFIGRLVTPVMYKLLPPRIQTAEAQ